MVGYNGYSGPQLFGFETRVNMANDSGSYSGGLATLTDGRVVDVRNTFPSSALSDQSAYAVHSQILDPRDGFVQGTPGADALYGSQTFATQVFGLNGNDSITGSSAGDQLFGRDGDDFLLGGNGQDTLTGGAGRDTFFFTTRTETADLVADFSEAEGDRIAVQGSNFSMPSGFKLTDGVGFFEGAGVTPQYQTATFYLDTNSHALWFDPDGTGAGGASVVAFMTNNPVMHAADIVVA